MKYRDALAFRQALENRLKSRAGDGAGLARDRKRVAFDRLLARLLSVAPGQWLLKGGFALDLRLVDRARSTKDIDIDWQADRDTLLEALIDASDFDASDFFTFTIERTAVSEDRLGGSHRFRVTASLAGRPFETFTARPDSPPPSSASCSVSTTSGPPTSGFRTARRPRATSAPTSSTRGRGTALSRACGTKTNPSRCQCCWDVWDGRDGPPRRHH